MQIEIMKKVKKKKDVPVNVPKEVIKEIVKEVPKEIVKEVKIDEELEKKKQEDEKEKQRIKEEEELETKRLKEVEDKEKKELEKKNREEKRKREEEERKREDEERKKKDPPIKSEVNVGSGGTVEPPWMKKILNKKNQQNTTNAPVNLERTIDTEVKQVSYLNNLKKAETKVKVDREEVKTSKDVEFKKEVPKEFVKEVVKETVKEKEVVKEIQKEIIKELPKIETKVEIKEEIKKEEVKEELKTTIDEEIDITEDECLDWVNEICQQYENFESILKSYETDFEDGIPLVAILNFYEPDLIDFDGVLDHNPEDNIHNCYSILSEIGFSSEVCGELDFGLDDKKTFKFLVEIMKFFELREN